jgi:hypothetical protein
MSHPLWSYKYLSVCRNICVWSSSRSLDDSISLFLIDVFSKCSTFEIAGTHALHRGEQVVTGQSVSLSLMTPINRSSGLCFSSCGNKLLVVHTCYYLLRMIYITNEKCRSDLHSPARCFSYWLDESGTLKKKRIDPTLISVFVIWSCLGMGHFHMSSWNWNSLNSSSSNELIWFD